MKNIFDITKNKNYFFFLILPFFLSCKGGNKVNQLNIVLSSGGPSVTATCGSKTCKGDCHKKDYVEFSYYDKFYTEYHQIPQNPRDPIASGFFIDDNGGTQSGGEGYLACNLPLPPGSGQTRLNNSSDNNIYIVADAIPIKNDLIAQSGISHFCANDFGDTDHKNDNRLIYSTFCLDNTPIVGCSSPTAADDAFKKLLKHYTCTIDSYSHLPIRPIDKSTCATLGLSDEDCFTLQHGNIDNVEIFTTILRLPNSNCVLRLSYRNKEVLNSVKVKTE